MTQLAQRLGLDLADTLTGNVELLADLLEGAGMAVLDAEAQAQDLFLTRGQGLEHIGRPVFTVQYHPEVCPGPMDTSYLFDKFIENIEKSKGGAQ